MQWEDSACDHMQVTLPISQALSLKPSAVSAHLDLPRRDCFLPWNRLRARCKIVLVKPALQRVDTTHAAATSIASFKREQIAPFPQQNHERAICEKEEHGERDRRPNRIDVATGGGVDLVVEVSNVDCIIEHDGGHPAAARDYAAECLRGLPALTRQQQPPDDAQRNSLQ